MLDHYMLIWFVSFSLKGAWLLQLTTLWAQLGLMKMVNQHYDMGTGLILHAFPRIFKGDIKQLLRFKSEFIYAGMEGVSYIMWRCWMMELTGVLEIMYIGSMMFVVLRHLRSYFMEMLSLRPAMLPYRLYAITISIFSFLLHSRNDITNPISSFSLYGLKQHKHWLMHKLTYRQLPFLDPCSESFFLLYREIIYLKSQMATEWRSLLEIQVFMPQYVLLLCFLDCLIRAHLLLLLLLVFKFQICPVNLPLKGCRNYRIGDLFGLL